MRKYRNNDKDKSIDPLCVFCLSPRFSIRKIPTSSGSDCSSVENCDSLTASVAPNRRPKATFLFSASKRRVNNRRKSSTSLNKTVAGLLNYKRRRTLGLEEILSTVQSVWKSPDNKSIPNSDEVMESTNNNSSTNELSPVLQRRRLSAPETVMRKHLLAQERSHSQESKHNINNYTWQTNIQSSSDPNLLSRKRDSNFMRKSTLLRRLWGNSKQKLSGSFHEWQHTYGKLSSTQSLNSVHSSPERSRFGSTQRLPNASPRRLSPKKIINNINIQSDSPKISVMNLRKTNSFESASNFNTNPNIPPLRLVSQDSTNYNSRNSATTKYTYSSFTTCSDNSDSAYTNSISNNHNSSNIMSSSANTSTKQTQNDENCNLIAQRNNLSKKGAQIQDITNLNVISNIKLSQKTLDVIVNQIMQDVNSLVPGEISISTATVTTNNFNTNPNVEILNKVPIKDNFVNSSEKLNNTNTQLDKPICDTSNNENILTETNPKDQQESFFLQTTENSLETSAESERIKNYIISTIKSGSTYIKPHDDPAVVPRFSAMPRTISMEVNTSNGEHENEESDSNSFVDSLEDFNSPRIFNHDDKPVGRSLDVYQLLPDGSNENKSRIKKSSAFFIPIEVEKKKELRSVSELLPLKVRQKLNQRQQKREEKCQQIKAANSFRPFGETLENKTKFSNGTNQRKRTKPVLPRITMLSKSSRVEKPANKENQNKRAKSETIDNSNRVRGSWSNRVRTKSEDHSVVFSNNNSQRSYASEPTKIYQKTEIKNSHKRIEILEIMECIEVSKSPRDKSKIPIPVQNRKLSFEKPVFLDMNKATLEDPKLDQLIANLLIDSLNHDEESENITTEKLQYDKKNANFYVSEPKSPVKQNSYQKYHQKFDAIPEEMSLQSTSEEIVNNNVENTNTEFSELLSKDVNKNIKFINVESPPLVMRKDDSSTDHSTKIHDSSSSIPKGWITFYTLRKDVKTPDSTSDEGKMVDKPMEKSSNLEDKEVLNSKQDSAKSNATYKIVRTEKQENLSISSSSEERSMIQQLSTNGRLRKPNSFQKKGRGKSNEDGNEKNNSGEWSVTISGSNSYGQTAPDVEMRLKFPNPNKYKAAPFNQNHSDSGLGEDNLQERNYIFPKIENKPSITDRYSRSKSSFAEGLPKIQTKDKRSKKRESSLISTSTTSMIMPRQNKASTCRYQLSRPRESFSLPDVPSRITQRHYSELLRRFPEILAVTGRSISPERKIIEREFYD